MKMFAIATIIAAASDVGGTLTTMSNSVLTSNTAANGGAFNNAASTAPSAISGLEISSYADFMVHIGDNIDPITGEFTRSTLSYEVEIDGTRYPAIVPSNTRRKHSKNNIPIQGILENGILTLDEAPFRILNPSEYTAKGVDINRLGIHGKAAEIGGVIEYFQDEISFNQRFQEQLNWESKIGPEKPTMPLGEDEFATPWTEGDKTLLFIRIDFPDDPGGPIGMTEQAVLDMMNNHVSPFFASNSYNKTSIQTTVTSVLTLPNPRSYYSEGGNWEQLLNHGRQEAIAAGYEPDFDLDLVAFNGNFANLCWSGAAACALVGGKGILLSGAGFTSKILSHELGHNYGLHHANQWVSSDGTPIGPGVSLEYGDTFDVMGNGFTPTHHFNGFYKRSLDWLTDSNVRTVINDGTYRIISQDYSEDGGVRALKIKKDDTRDYWITRRGIANHPNLDNGAVFHWRRENDGRNNSLLLDMNTPGTTIFDSPLTVGQSFLDNQLRTRFTILDNDNLPESISVKVEFNVGCTYSLVQSSEDFTASGGEGFIVVHTEPACTPPTTDDSKWIQVIESNRAPNNAFIRYIVLPNYGAARTGTINVGGQIFTIQQSAQTTACVIPPTGLIAWWQGDGNALDQTGKNGGVLRNISTSLGGGKIGGAFRTVDISSNYIETNEPIVFVPDSDSLTLTNSLTIEGWVRINNAPPFVVQVSVIRRSRKGFFLPASYAIDVVSGQLRFLINANSDGSSYDYVISPTILPYDELVHFAATLDDSTGSMRIYMNGALVHQITTSLRPYQMLPSDGGILIGASSNILDYSIDELSIYNRSLSVSEVQSIYDAGNAPGGAAGKCPLSNYDQTPFDFDGDRRSDLSILHRDPVGGFKEVTWQILSSQKGYFETQFGYLEDRLVPADYDNDGKTDIAIFGNGTWYLQQSSEGYVQVEFGLPEDIPQPADFNGDGRSELAVFRPSNGTWHWLNLVNSQTNTVQFGISTDKPVVGDYDGDGLADYAVYRPSQGIWHLLQSTNGSATIQFGLGTDHTVPADYDGDGKTDIAVFRPSTGEWHILRSSDFGITTKQLGGALDFPVPGDYDGDGKTDLAVWREGSGLGRGQWSIIQSHNNQLKVEYFGDPGDIALPSVFTHSVTDY